MKVKYRPCRECSRCYAVIDGQSEFPGTCSESCSVNRQVTLYLRKMALLNITPKGVSEYMVGRYKCLTCSRVFINCSLEEINQHRATHGSSEIKIHSFKPKKTFKPVKSTVLTRPLSEIMNLPKKSLTASERKLKKAEIHRRISESRASSSTKTRTASVVSGHNKPWPKHEFYDSQAWLELRFRAFVKYGRTCMCCGSTEQLHVDHVKPRSKYPELSLDINNLQILCRACNLGKMTTIHDFRPGATP